MKIANKLLIKLYLSISIALLTLNSIGQQAITPSSYPGLKLWLTGDSVNISSGLNIDTCYDLSNNQRHAFQNNIFKQPLSQNSLLNNHKVIKFDGLDDFLTFNELDSIRTCIMILKHATGSSTDNPPILGHSVHYDFIGSMGNELFLSLFLSPYIIGGELKVNKISLSPFTVTKPTSFIIFSLLSSGNLRAEYVTNDRNANGCWNGEYAEIIIYNRVLNAIELNNIENYLNNKYAPDIKFPNNNLINTNFCATNLITTGNFDSYQWSTGATTSSITVNQSGKYWVNATNVFGKVSSDTILVNYPKPNLKSDTSTCEGNSFIWNTQLPKSDFTFQWQDNSTDSLFTINTPGQYYVSITDGFGCSYNSNTITVTQDNFASTASLGPDVSLCAGNQIALITGLQPGLSYTWSSGETTPAITITNTAEYSVIITNTNNCIAKDTINVSITGQAPNPNFTFNQACINTPIQFTDASFAPSGNSIASYLWDFGDPLSASNTSTLSNPTHSYTNTGIYTVSLTVSTDVGCSKSITKTLTVSATPTVNFNFGIACQNSAVTFTGSISSGTLTTTATTWNFGDPASGANNSSALLNPSHVFSNQANYPVKLIATNSAGCKDSITKIVNVRGEVKADFTYSAPCANSNVLFQDNSITPAPSNVHTRTWNFSNSANTFIGLTTNQTFTNSGVYSASLTVTGTNGCVSSISKLITVQLKPVVNFTVPPICAKDTVSIINNSSVGSGVFSSFNWQLNTNSFSSANSPTLSIANSGTYSLSLKITNSAQCADSLTKLITVFALPIVDFETNPPIYLFLDSTVTFIPNSTTGSFYQWNINSEVFNSVTPSYTFNPIGTYSVSLFMRDENGCGNFKAKNVRVFDHYLDLAIRDIITSLDNENFLRVKANLLNMGSVPISKFEISKRINSVSDSKESWTGQLNPGNQLLYEFVSTNKLSNTADNKIICLQIESINLMMDNNTTNNKLCVALKTNGNEVFEPYPNPSFKEDVIIPVLLTNDQIVSIELYNTVGEIVITTLSYTGTEGLNFIKIPSSELSRGTYLLKLTINEKVFMKKLMKN